ncbi:MAG: ATP-grasp enzyme [Cyanobacteria bacterium Co-bin13]|nr:ATP-grasp enzyme [Cyanobacteria bacterium Co-bin13]
MPTKTPTQTTAASQQAAIHPAPPAEGHPNSLFRALWQNLGTLALLALAFPFNCVAVLLALVWTGVSSPFQKAPVRAEPAKTILIAGARMTKTLMLARAFYAAGHRVILIDTEKFWLSGNQFSRAVAGFYTMPDPQQDLAGYTQKLQAIAQKENVDLFIPVAIFSVIYPEGMDQHPLAGYCEVCHFDAAVTGLLDDKFAFAEKARSLGLSVPKSFKITAPEQVLNFDFSQEPRQYILKSIPYDACRRLNLTKLPCPTPAETAVFVNSLPISEKTPWILQEFIPGQEYCTHSTVRNGQSTLYCCCESSAFQVNYERADNPEIDEWVRRFLKGVDGFGQASFDFIQAPDGTAYAIECNPRTHSAITLFYNHPQVAASYLNPDFSGAPLEPLLNSRPTYWLYHELWRLNEVRSLSQLQTWWHNIWRGKEAVFEVNDPLPFLMVHHWQIPLLVLGNLRRLQSWIRIDFNIGEVIR